MDGGLWPGLALLLVLWKAIPLALEGLQPAQAPPPVLVPNTECKCVFEVDTLHTFQAHWWALSLGGLVFFLLGVCCGAAVTAGCWYFKLIATVHQSSYGPQASRRLALYG